MKAQWMAVGLAVVLALPVAAQEEPKLGKPAEEEAKPDTQGAKLELTDGKLPLWELRPLDRRVYVVSLDGVWRKPGSPDASYQLTVRFPDGRTWSHRPINDRLFFLGEMRFMIPQYMLIRTGAARGGKLELFVTERLTAGGRPEVISNTVELTWPLRRPVLRRAPATKVTPRPPIDAMPGRDRDNKQKREELDR
jgi:hypothetical protein